MAIINIALAFINIALAMAVYQIDKEVRHIDTMLSAISDTTYHDETEEKIDQISKRLDRVEQICLNNQNKVSVLTHRFNKGIIYEAPVQEDAVSDK